MINPFNEKYREDNTDEMLITKAVEGNRIALEELIIRHQDWIYNIALRMVYYADEAKDVTQETLIKIITKLSSFKKESSFRTWAYRIVINHVLSMKKSRGESGHYSTFSEYGKSIDKTPDFELSEDTNLSFDTETVIEEVKQSCLNGMLLCLNREQRVIFILGSIFRVSDSVGCEIMEISRENFRQKLSRARKELFNFMNDKCGLIKKSNPCRCAKKTKALVDSGYVNPGKLIFNTNYVMKIKQATGSKLERFEDYAGKEAEKIFEEQPFNNSPDNIEYLKRLINTSEFKEIFNFN
ncbi:MAG: RNA polymerase sigma factor [Ignavibacteriae bacterium]|nr:RNA polymerase sigma factor [Ignavibacteriota bacterium]